MYDLKTAIKCINYNLSEGKINTEQAKALLRQVKSKFNATDKEMLDNV